MGGVAQLREQVLAAALGAAERNLFGEIRNDALAAVDAARHRRAGQRLADHGDRGRHHIDEGTGDVDDLGPDVGAQERGRGEIERELFHGGIKQHRPRLRLPLRNPCRDAGVETGKIGFHRPRLEGDRQRATVQPMFLEVEQHQSARKQQPENPAPAVHRGKQLGLVEQHQFVGFRSEQGEAGFAEQVAAIDQPVSRRCPFDLTLGIGEHVKRLSDDRPTLVTRNMRQRIALRRGEGEGGGNHTVHRHGNCS